MEYMVDTFPVKLVWRRLRIQGYGEFQGKEYQKFFHLIHHHSYKMNLLIVMTGCGENTPVRKRRTPNGVLGILASMQHPVTHLPEYVYLLMPLQVPIAIGIFPATLLYRIFPNFSPFHLLFICL